MDVAEEEPRRLLWESEVRAKLKSFSGPVADFNVAPTLEDAILPGDRRLYSSTKPWEQRELSRTMNEFRMVDAYRHFHPMASMNDVTWHEKVKGKSKKGAAMRIDLHLFSEAIINAPV